MKDYQKGINQQDPRTVEKRVLKGNQSSPGANTVKGPFIERIGQGSITVNGGNSNQAVLLTFSPALTDPVLTNYRVFASIHNAAVNLHVMNLILFSTTQISIRLGRESLGVLTNTTGVTVTPGSLASVTDTDPVATAHGADADALPHSHGTTAHTIVDPGHLHNPDTTGALTATVDFLIIHI